MDLVNQILSQEKIFSCLFILLFLWQLKQNKERETNYQALLIKANEREQKLSDIINTKLNRILEKVGVIDVEK